MARPSDVLAALMSDLAVITYRWCAANQALASNVSPSPDRAYTWGMPLIVEDVDQGNQATIAVPYRGRLTWQIPFVKSARDQGTNLGPVNAVMPFDLTVFDVSADLRRIFYTPTCAASNVCDDIRIGKVVVAPPEAATSAQIVMGSVEIVCIYEDDHRLQPYQEP